MTQRLAYVAKASSTLAGHRRESRVSNAGRRARRPTIKDVAARVGVSPMTVSRAINGQEGMRPETRTAIMAAIEALGYKPNAAARSLVTSGELRIGVIYSNRSAAFMSEFLTGAFEEAASRGARLVILRAPKGKDPSSKVLKKFIASGLSGVTIRTAASDVSGASRSTSRSDTIAARAAFASRGEIAAAMSRTGVPAGTRRLDPSGSVTVTSLMEWCCLRLCREVRAFDSPCARHGLP